MPKIPENKMADESSQCVCELAEECISVRGWGVSVFVGN